MTAIIVTGLGFGDEGKGATVDALTAKYGATLNVRYNGGAQAAHHVVTPDGRTHCFSQFGAGTFAGAYTHLSAFMRVEPLRLWNEAQALIDLGERDIFSRLTIDERALVITPYHTEQSRRSAAIHQRGTCGVGVGEALRFAELYPGYALRMGDLHNYIATLEKLQSMQALYGLFLEQRPDEIAESLTNVAAFVNITDSQQWLDLRRMHETIIFEGAQGVLLDKERGTKPFVTSSNTTQENARALLTGYEGEIKSYGVLRMYATRHGVGTFPTETDVLNHLPEIHNTPNEYQGEMRNGWLDLELTKRAIKINGGVDSLVINHLDLWSKCARWKLGNINYYNQRMYIEDIVGALQTPLYMIGAGYTRNERDYDYMA